MTARRSAPARGGDSGSTPADASKPEAFEQRLRAFAETLSAIPRTPSVLPDEPPATTASEQPGLMREPSEPARSDRARPPGTVPTSHLEAAPVAGVPHRTERQAMAGFAARMTRMREAFARAARRSHRRSDGEAVHDLRVSSRRLIAALRMWRELFRPGPARQARRRLRALRRSMGRVRELEVHVAWLESFGGAPDATTRAVIEVLLAQLRRRLASASARAARRVRPRRLRAIVRTLERAGSEIPERIAAFSQAPELARARTARQEVRAGEALRLALERRDDDSLHRARVALKKWRYSIEALAVNEPDEAARVESLRELQDVLGSIQDGASMRVELGADPEVGAEAPRPLAPLIEAIERDREAALERLAVSAQALLAPTR